MASFDVTRAEFETLKMDIDMWYLTVMGILVFFMQAGFALLEAGSVRAKNTKNILMKNLLDACIGALVWWAWGYAVAVCPASASAICQRALALFLRLPMQALCAWL